MAWTGSELPRGKTVLPTDIFMFAFLAMAVSAGSRVVTGNEISIVVLTIAWMSAAITRLTELRRGDRPALQLRGLNLRTTATLIVGTGPWLMLGVLQRAYPSSAIWAPIEVAPWLRALGISLAMAVIAEPFLPSIRRSRPAGSSDDYRFSESVMIRSVAILLLSGSPVFAVLCALWLGTELWRPAAPIADGPELPILPLPFVSPLTEIGCRRPT
jgi:hypothetical protein